MQCVHETLFVQISEHLMVPFLIVIGNDVANLTMDRIHPISLSLISANNCSMLCKDCGPGRCWYLGLVLLQESTIQIKGSITMIKTIVHLANCGECWEENRVILETILKSLRLRKLLHLSILALLSLTVPYLALQGFTGPYWALLSLT